MQRALDESNRRRQYQEDYNKQNGITPFAIKKAVHDVLESGDRDQGSDVKKLEISVVDSVHGMSNEQILQKIAQLDKQMLKASKALDFEKAAAFPHEIHALKELVFSAS